MSGHSKWATIKRKKEKTDAQRGKVFTKIGREIAVAVKAGGADVNLNSRLRDVVAKAKSNNMPNDNIIRCIKKAEGDSDSAKYEDIVYEGYGPAGTAFIVEVSTDNRNRTAADIRHYFDKFGGNLGQTGSVSFMFEHKGVIVLDFSKKSNDLDKDEFTLELIDSGADDVEFSDEFIQVVTRRSDFHSVLQFIEGKGLEIVEAEIKYVPNNMVELTDEADITKFDRLIDALEDNDDVMNVSHNCEA